MTAHYDTCRRGHELTRKNVKVHRKHGRMYRECRKCAAMATEGRHQGLKSKYAATQKALNGATIERKPMKECWSCPPSLYTGVRGNVQPDPDDGDPKCDTCGRAQLVTVVLEEV